ncbi:odorant receptor 67a-like [Pogonomyrmex barbatus]|uniref:Odorant receptor n=1 Tax=Pogonomyrmex barbatus TaxID=144034 RepID=A0A8N1S702_9HYME|nr:odorant receptor 67a-like [Pogonomyrmex barbatus]
MNFQSVNLLNVRLNTFSGNLLPMTSDDTQFSIVWKIYSGFVWLIELIRAVSLIPGIMHVSRGKTLEDATVAIVFTIEVIFMVMRIQFRGTLVREFIQKLNDILRTEDEIMKNVVTMTMEPMKIPLNFYWFTGLVAVIVWGSIPLMLLFKKTSFYYEDYRMPVAFSKQPFSTEVFLLGSLFISIASMYMFSKKVGLDVYMIHLVLMITTQYRYIAVKLEEIFRNGNSEDECNSSKERHSKRKDLWTERELRAICRHHNTVIHLSFTLKKLLSLNFSLIYVNSILRFSFIGIMLSTVLSTIFIEGFSILIFACAEIVQFYVLCSSVQQLLDASTKMTDLAFHKNWYQFGTPIKRTFMLMILGNNLECKLAAFEKFNLSLPSFMTVMNQAYSIALLFLKMK